MNFGLGGPQRKSPAQQRSRSPSLATVDSESKYNETQQPNKKKRTLWTVSLRKPVHLKRTPRNVNSFGNKKAMFSNERTMVHWIKSAMLMGSLAMTLLSFGDNNVTPFVGVALLMVCLITLIYSNTIFQVRMEWLSMRRDDVKYYDRFAPTAITLLVMSVFAFNAAMSFNGNFKVNPNFFK